MAEIKAVNEIIAEISPYYKKRKELKEKELVASVAEVEHTLVYDSSSETLEPVYFFIMDLMENRRLAPEKLIDNFTSTPGSGHFSELGQKTTLMQQQATKILGDVNTVLRSVLNIIYDLRDFKIRLQSYDDLNSNKKETREAAIQSLKQIWLDRVDVQRGQGSIHMMTTGNLQFVTLRDAFLVAKDEKDVDKLDLNDRVKRILQSRVHEFNIWVEQSGRELRKRYELERTYLKSQVSSLKLYSRWAKPYLRAAAELEQKEMSRNAALVKTFNTIILELTLLGKTKLKVKDAAIEGNLPRDFINLKTKRDYYSCILVDFKFRGIPAKVGQHYTFGGKAYVTFRAYSLNEDELKKLNQELDKSDIGDVLRLVEGTTSESLDQLQEEINFFLEEKDKEEEKLKKPGDSSNPFKALFGGYEAGAETKKESKEKIISVKPDEWIEKNQLRRYTAEKAADVAFDIFDIYKKAHGMPSFT